MLKVVTLLSTLRDPMQLRQRQCVTSYNLQVIAGGILFDYKLSFPFMIRCTKIKCSKKDNNVQPKKGVLSSSALTALDPSKYLTT